MEGVTEEGLRLIQGEGRPTYFMPMIWFCVAIGEPRKRFVRVCKRSDA